MLPRCADLSTIPEGLETLRQGKDPRVTNPTDALGRPMNYPRIWLYLFSALGINVQNIWTIAIPILSVLLDLHFGAHRAGQARRERGDPPGRELVSFSDAGNGARE